MDQNSSSNFGRGSPKEHSWIYIPKSIHWLRRRCRLQVFLFLALVAILFNKAEPHLGMFVTTGCSSRRQFVATASRQDTGSRQQNTDSGRQVTASGQFYKPSQTQESKYSSYALLLLCRLKWKNGSTFNERNFM